MSETRATLGRAVIASVVLAAVLLLALGTPATAQFGLDEADGDRPLLWNGQASAAAVWSSINTHPAMLPFPDFVRFDVPDGESYWDSTGRASARAAELWPGIVVAGGLGLLCDEVLGCPEGTVPDYPFIARAEHPTNPEETSPSGFARVSASMDLVETVASLTGHEGLDAIGELIAVGAVDARTRQEFIEGILTARAVSRLQNVSLFDGAITIESIEARSLSRTDGEGVTEDATRISVKGVEVEGNAARITQDGIEVVEQGDEGALLGGVGEVTGGLSEGFEAIGLDIRLVGTDVDTEPGRTSGQAQGVLVSFNIPVEGPPLPPLTEIPGVGEILEQFPPEFPTPDGNFVYREYQISFLLGMARTAVFADNEGFGLGDLGDLGDFEDDLAPAPSGFDDTATARDDFAPAPVRDDIAPTPAPTFDDAPPPADDSPVAAPGDGPAPSEPGFALLGGEASDQLGLLYLTTLLTVGGLFAFSRLQARRVSGGPPSLT